MNLKGKMKLLYQTEYERGFSSAKESSQKMTAAEREAELNRAYGSMESFDYGWQDFFAGRPNRYEDETR